LGVTRGARRTVWGLLSSGGGAVQGLQPTCILIYAVEPEAARGLSNQARRRKTGRTPPQSKQNLTPLARTLSASS